MKEIVLSNPIFRLTTRGETWGLKKRSWKRHPSDKGLVRMKLTDSCVLGGRGAGGKIGFSPEPDAE